MIVFVLESLVMKNKVEVIVFVFLIFSFFSDAAYCNKDVSSKKRNKLSLSLVESGGNRPPSYPKKARDKGKQQDELLVKIKVVISKKGKITKAVIVRSCGNKALDNAALKAVKKYRFYPAKENGVAVESVVILPLRFKMD